MNEGMPPEWVQSTLADLVRRGDLEEVPDGHYRFPVRPNGGAP